MSTQQQQKDSRTKNRQMYNEHGACEFRFEIQLPEKRIRLKFSVFWVLYYII